MSQPVHEANTPSAQDFLKVHGFLATCGQGLTLRQQAIQLRGSSRLKRRNSSLKAGFSKRIGRDRSERRKHKEF